MSEMIVTTADLKCEYEVIGPVQYQVSNKGILSSAFSLAKNRYQNAAKDMGSGWSAIYGEWGLGHNDFDAAFYISVQELKERAKKLGADAIIGMRQDIDMDTGDYSSFYIQMYGTAVKFVEKECEAPCEPAAEEEKPEEIIEEAAPAAVEEAVPEFEEAAPAFEEPAPAFEEPAPIVVDVPEPVFEEPAPAFEEAAPAAVDEPARFTFEEPAPSVFDPAPLTFEPTPSVYEDTEPVIEAPEPAPIEIKINEEPAPAAPAAAAPKKFEFCPNCGAPLRDGAAFCTNCGTPVASMGTPKAEPVQAAPAPAAAAPADHSSTIELLLKYKGMLDRGEITQEQFEAMKKSIL